MSNVIFLLAISETTLAHLKSLEEKSSELSSFHTILNAEKANNYTKAINENEEIGDAYGTFTGELEYLQPIYDFILALTPIAEFVNATKNSSVASRVKRSVPNESDSYTNFLNQTQMFSTFEGMKSFIDSVNKTQSEEHDPYWQDWIKQTIRFEVEISNQLTILEPWGNLMKYVGVLFEAIESIQSIAKNKIQLLSFANKLRGTTENMMNMAQVHKAKVGYGKFCDMVIWLQKFSKWNETLSQIRGSSNNIETKEAYPILHQISQLISFFKRFLVDVGEGDIDENQLKASLNRSDIAEKVQIFRELRRKISSKDEKHNSKIETRYKGYVDKATKNIVDWNDAIGVNLTDHYSNEDVSNSLIIINNFKTSLEEVNKKKQMMSGIRNDTEKLGGLCNAARVMDQKVLDELEEKLKSISKYDGKKLNISALNSTNILSLLSTTQSQPSVLKSLAKSLRVYSNLIDGLNSADEIQKTFHELSSNEELPEEVSVFLEKYKSWFKDVSSIEILNQLQINVKSVTLLNEIEQIMKNLDKMLVWLANVPKEVESSRVRRSNEDLRSAMAENSLKSEFEQLIQLTEKAQDSETSNAIKQLKEDLAILAELFGIVVQPPTAAPPNCQIDPNDPRCSKEDQTGNLPAEKDLNDKPQDLRSENGHEFSSTAEYNENLIVFVGVVVGLLVILIIFLLVHAYRAIKNKYYPPKSKKTIKEVSLESRQRQQELERLMKLFPNVQDQSINQFTVVLSQVGHFEDFKAKCEDCNQDKCKLVMKDGKKLNKKPNISACQEDNRVPLMFDGSPQYINAQFIEMPNKKKFIATQAPMEDTVDHFLEMIMQYKVGAVCRLCSFDECVNYTNRTERFNIEAIRNEANTMKTFENGDSYFDIDGDRYTEKMEWLEVTLKRKSDGEELTFLLYSSEEEWPENDFPVYPTATTNMLILAKMNANNSPIVVHGLHGVGRTMSFIGIEYAMQTIEKNSEKFDKVDCLKKLRAMRRGAVANQLQMCFMIYGVAQTWISRFKVRRTFFPNLRPQLLQAVEEYKRVRDLQKVLLDKNQQLETAKNRVMEIEDEQNKEESGVRLLKKALPTYEKNSTINPFLTLSVGPRTYDKACEECAKEDVVKCEFGTEKALNRYDNLTVCQEKTRVNLTFNGKPQYINAQFVTMPDGKKYIATQGPLPATIDHFWEMVFSQCVRVICMLCKLEEPPKKKHEKMDKKCANYMNPNEGKEEFGPSGFRVEKKVLPCELTGITKTELTVERLSDKEKRCVTHFWNTDWPDHETPNNPDETLKMLEEANELRAGAPIVVHCSAGVGRTMAFIGIDYAFQSYTRKNGYPDRAVVIHELRMMRSGALPEPKGLYFMFYGLIRMWLSQMKIQKQDFPDLEEKYKASIAKKPAKIDPDEKPENKEATNEKKAENKEATNEKKAENKEATNEKKAENKETTKRREKKKSKKKGKPVDGSAKKEKKDDAEEPKKDEKPVDDRKDDGAKSDKKVDKVDSKKGSKKESKEKEKSKKEDALKEKSNKKE